MKHYKHVLAEPKYCSHVVVGTEPARLALYVHQLQHAYGLNSDTQLAGQWILLDWALPHATTPAHVDGEAAADQVWAGG